MHWLGDTLIPDDITENLDTKTREIAKICKSLNLGQWEIVAEQSYGYELDIEAGKITMASGGGAGGFGIRIVNEGKYAYTYVNSVDGIEKALIDAQKICKVSPSISGFELPMNDDAEKVGGMFDKSICSIEPESLLQQGDDLISHVASLDKEAKVTGGGTRVSDRPEGYKSGPRSAKTYRGDGVGRKAEASKEKAKSPSGTYRNVGAGKKEKAGGEMKAEPKSASEPNQERIKKAREKLKKAAKGSPSRGVRFATPGGKVAPTVMRSGRDASDERKKAAKKFAKKAGISDSFEYLLGEIFEDMIVEGYVDDYETASCVLESLTDDDFDYVCEAYSIVLNEATAMAKRGLDEPAIRNKIAKDTVKNTSGSGAAADRAKALAGKETYGDADKKHQRGDFARRRTIVHRRATSTDRSLRVGGHQSNDPAVKAKQAARGAQRARASLTPAERKQLNMGEGFDTFDVVLEYLYVEGYADTIEEAEAMMVNLTPEQIDEIVNK